MHVDGTSGVDAIVALGVSGAVRVRVDYKGRRLLLLVGATDISATTHRLKNQTFGVACVERGHCAHAFRMGSSNSSFSWKSCTYASIAFYRRDHLRVGRLCAIRHSGS